MSTDNTDNTTSGRPRIPDEDLEAEFHRVATLDETGDTPTWREMSVYGKHAPERYNERHDGWDNAVIHYGYEPNDLSGPRISDEQLEADFHAFADELDEDRGPRRLEMDEEGPHASTTYCERIEGSWDDVLLHYGYEPNKLVFAYSAAETREIMQCIAIDHERPPEPEDVPEDVREDIRKRWDSWWVAQELCGVTKRDLDAFFATEDESS